MNRYEILLKKEQKRVRTSSPTQYRRLYVGGRASGKTLILIKDIKAMMIGDMKHAGVFINHYDNVKHRWRQEPFPSSVSLEPLLKYRDMSYGRGFDCLFFDDLPMKDLFYEIAELIYSSNVKYIAVTCGFDEFMNFTAKDTHLCNYLYNNWIIDQLQWSDILYQGLN